MRVFRIKDFSLHTQDVMSATKLQRRCNTCAIILLKSRKLRNEESRKRINDKMAQGREICKGKVRRSVQLFSENIKMSKILLIKES